VARNLTEAIVASGTAQALCAPRQLLVQEGPGSTRGGQPEGATITVFEQAEGPMALYRRTLELWPRPDGTVRARQEVELRVGLPWWSWLLSIPLHRSLGRLSPSLAHQGPMPWWAPPARLDRRVASVLANLAALVAVQGFVAGLLPETLTYAASQMHVSTLGQGVVFGAVGLSAVPALAALVAADHRGRRAVVIWATAGAVVLSEGAALSPSVGWLAASQVLVGALVTAAGIAATVAAVEEVPRRCRAWALGVLGLAAGFGAGLPLALLPLAGLGQGGWRWLYALSLACVPVVLRAGRQLPESRRWSADHHHREPLAPARPEPEPRAPGPGPAKAWLATPGARLGLVCAGAALFALFATPATEFETQFLRHERHYSALTISLLEQLAGTIGAVGVLFGGRLADTRGRRPVAAACVAGATAGTMCFYLSHGVVLWAWATIGQFFLYASAPALGVYGAELFATATRARAAGLVAASAAVGGVAGVLATGAGAGHVGHLAPALAALCTGPVLLIVLLALAYPETAGVALEDLS
jgi:MFS family permease